MLSPLMANLLADSLQRDKEREIELQGLNNGSKLAKRRRLSKCRVFLAYTTNSGDRFCQK